MAFGGSQPLEGNTAGKIMRDELSPAAKAVLVLACGIGMYFTVGIFLIYGFSVFVGPITAETGWERAAVMSAVMPVAILSGLPSPAVGALADRFGPRRILLVSAVTMGAGFIGIAYGSHDLPSFLVWFTVAALLGSAQTGVPYTHVIVGWFGSRRGLALGSMLAFAGLGVATMPAILAVAIEAFGWRAALAGAGCVAMAVLFPLAAFVIRDPPQGGAGRDAAPTGEGFRAALGTAAFWLILAAFPLNSAVAIGGSVSLPVILADRGASAELAASVIGVVGAALIGARAGFGALIDRTSPLLLTAAAFCAPVLGHHGCRRSRPGRQPSRRRRVPAGRAGALPSRAEPRA